MCRERTTHDFSFLKPAPLQAGAALETDLGSSEVQKQLQAEERMRPRSRTSSGSAARLRARGVHLPVPSTELSRGLGLRGRSANIVAVLRKNLILFFCGLSVS